MTIHPRIPDPPPLWVAGGSLTHAPDTPDKPFMAKGVLDRIAQAAGWMARSSGSDPGDVKRDWQVVRSHLEAQGRDPDDLVFAATQFLHVTEIGPSLGGVGVRRSPDSSTSWGTIAPSRTCRPPTSPGPWMT